MRVLLLAFGLLAGSASAQPRLLLFPSEPLHDSAARAYLYSAAATLGTAGVGYILSEVLPEGDPTLDSYAPRDVGYFIIALGVVGGPSVGNVTLAAGEDVGRGLMIRVVGLGVAAAGLAGAVMVCLPRVGFGGDCSPEGEFFLGVAVAGLAGGLVGGTVYDLATIPGNAREARERLRGPDVSIGLGAQAAQPVLAVRVGL